MRRPNAVSVLLALIVLCSAAGCAHRVGETGSPAAAPTGRITFDSFHPEAVVEGFGVAAVYTDARDRPVGARLKHEATGFDLALMRIQSVPQAFVWVHSLPTSDMGEPHTQEHLLLGKGNKGRYVASLESMSLADSSAFTQQTRTAYHFHTTAGAETFWMLFEKRLDALLHPDYTDEEIRREVRHIGVTENPGTGVLRLEEKGTVYNEMVSSFERPWSRLGREMQLATYGANHPLSFVSGGLPAAIREMGPDDIRRFHRENYHLAGMGAVVALPDAVSLGEAMARMSEILSRLQGSDPRRVPRTEADLPPAKAAPEGRISLVTYPHQNAENPGDMILVWPAALELDNPERLLLELFAGAFAGDDTTPLYRIFVDSSTREIDLGATGVFGGVSDEKGHSVWVGLSNLAAEHLTEQTLDRVRGRVLDEIAAIAALEEGSESLKAFDSRVRSRVIARRRTLSKFVSSPPRFGFRNTGSAWMDHIERLERSPGFERSLVMKDDLDSVLELVDSGRNIWREGIERWKLLDAKPYAFAGVADPGLAEGDRGRRDERLEAELVALRERYATGDDREALERFRDAYAMETRRLDELATKVATPGFIDTPPLTLDDQLRYEQRSIGDIDMLFSRFDSMTGATAGIALRLDGLDDRQLLYLAVLPELLTEAGIVEDGVPLGHAEMREQLRREILGLDTYYSSNFRTGRVELVVRGAGNDPAESERAVAWMRRVLANPDWRPENLPRLRDLVDRSVSGLRNRMRRPEEHWVRDPARAYWRQSNRLLLGTESFLTRSHNAHRLRWMLREVDPADRTAVASFLGRLAEAAREADQSQLAALAAAIQGKQESSSELPGPLTRILAAAESLSPAAGELARDAAGDLELLLSDLPDSSLSRDWAYLAAQIQHDLLRAPARALDDLDKLRRSLLKSGNARMFAISAGATMETLDDELGRLVSVLATAPARPRSHEGENLIHRRLLERAPRAGTPVFVGLVNPNTQGGVFLNSAPDASYADTDPDAILRHLAAKLYGGGGAHSMFMKTWGAGLAYSNGLGSSPESGRKNYYAERCPELPQTLLFVIDQLRGAESDPSLVDYTVAQVFGSSRAASSYEARGESMAENLVDGTTPDSVSRFRRAVLATRETPGLAEKLFEQMEAVYGELLPGYGPPSATVEDAVYFVIGPERQMELFEEYLRSVEGPETRLHRLYPRDFWIPATLPGA